MTTDNHLPLLLAAALVLAACSPAPPPAPAAPPDTAAATASAGQPAEPQPQRGGAFHLATARNIPHLYLWENPSNNVQASLHMGYDTLVDLDYRPFEDWRTHYRVVPSLAEKWELQSPTSYLFQLRAGVRWHDGTPLTARDIAWAYDYLRDPKYGFVGRRSVEDIQQATALDDRTLQITTRTPQVNFLPGLSDNSASILARHVHERGDNLRQVAVGTGPFKLESYDREKGLVYVRNDDYWGSPQPYLDRIRLFTGLDRAAMTAAFFAKQNDMMKLADKPQLDPILRTVPDARYQAFLRDSEAPISLKLDRPPFNDMRVRQAIHLALDRQAMITALTYGTGLANPPGMNGGRTGWVIPQEELKTLPGWRQPKDQDRAEAKRLLAEAGYSPQAGGLTFEIMMDRLHSDAPVQAEVIAAQLREVGVNVKIGLLEQGVYEKRRAEGDFEAWMGGIARFAAEREWNEFYRSGGRLNQSPIADPELDRLIEAQNQEFDVAKRQKLWIDLQRLMLKNLYNIPTITFTNYQVWQPWAGGWVDNFAGQAHNMDWGQTWLDLAKVPPGRS